MSDDTIICTCYSVTLGDIKNAIKNGATSLEELQEVTGLGTACGQCVDTHKDLLNSLLSNK